MKYKQGILLSSKQPSGLWFICASILFITFGLTSVLTLFGGYGAQVLGFEENYATALSIGSYLFLMNFTAVAGGMIGRKYGHKRVVSLGGLYAAFGLWMISINNLALMGLAAFAVGAGLIIPNIYASLSRLYSTDDPRRNAGFTLLFMTGNFGIFLNSVIAAYLAKYIGYDHAFLISAVFTVIGTIIFVRFDKDIAKQSLTTPKTDTANSTSSDATLAIIGLMVIITGFTRYLLDNLLLNMMVMISFCLISIIYIVYLALKHKGVSRHRLLGLLFLIIICISFWFAERLSSVVFIEYSGMLTHGKIFGWTQAPEDIVNLINTLVIAVVAIIFALYWTSKKKGQFFLTLPALIAIALLLSSAAFVLLWLGEKAGDAQHFMDASTYLIASFFLMAIAKTIAIPLYYGMVGKLAPREYESTLIGIMQLFIGFSGIVAIALTHNAFPHDIIIQSTEYNTISVVTTGLIGILIILALFSFWISKKWRRTLIDEKS